MKYIRTKDGHRFIRIDDKLYDLENMPNGVWFDGTNIKDSDDWDSANIYTNCFDSQTNIIEELFDDFVIIGSDEYQKYIKHSLKEALQKKEWLERLGYTCNIYGSIWTNNGLIYKAKMKGVLPNGEIDWELL